MKIKGKASKISIVILIILLIILGIIAYWIIDANFINHSGDYIHNPDYLISNQEKRAFNDQFYAYNGEHKSSLQVKTLYEEARKSNEINQISVTMKIDNVLVIGQRVKNGDEIIDKLSKQNKYTIECKDEENNGLIDTIIVTTEE